MPESLRTPVGACILNVNDNEATRYMISRMLERAGFSVVEARSGEEALGRIATHKPRVVVLDIKLPGANGLEVCRAIKKDPGTQSIKVLHTSAVFVATEYKVQSLDSGADAYLTHPFEQEELIATVRSLLRLTEAEQALRDRAEELRAVNRRTNEFLAMLAHELRNPLAAIVTSRPLLERRPAIDVIEQTARDVIKRQTTHLTRLVDDLLDVGRVTQGKIELNWETLDIAELLARVVANIQQTKTGARQQTLSLKLSGHPVLVRGDAMRLEQVFTNLLDNSTKYTESGGSIDVAMDAVREGDGGLLKTRIVVRDSGMGIPAETLPTIFNLFSQADVPLARSRGGLGIGLTLVRSLVELHGGTVTARSEGSGRGSEFEVLLPVVAAEVSHIDTRSEQVPAADLNLHRRKVLVIEDNVDAQETLKSLLEMCGHEVSVAGDGAEGIEAALRIQPDIALIDLGLPSMDGYEVARHVRSSPHGSHLLLVALTGYGAPEQKRKALEAGFDLHLVKPVDPDHLLKLIAKGTAGQRVVGMRSRA